MSYETMIVERRDGIAVAKLNRPPANAINMRMCTELLALLDELEADPNTHGLVLTGRPGMFSAGLDIIALRKLNREMMRLFWGRFCDAFMRLYTSPLATAAAISGHSPAGGTVLSLGCDFRVIADGDYKMGLNEVAVGLPVPRFLCMVHAALVGQRHTERLLPHGTMSSPEGALMIGLVDAVVEADQVLPLALKEVGRRLQAPAQAREQTKLNLRRQTIAGIGGSFSDEVEALTEGWFSNECVTVMGELITKLTKKRR